MSDLISRQAAIEMAVDVEIPQGAYERAIYVDDLMALPSADRPTVDKEYLIDLIQESVYDGEACAKLIDLVDRPTGEWIRNDNGTYSCCVCQSWIPEEQHGYARYCLYCGAKMKGGDDE